MERRIYSVSQVNRYINGLFAADFLLEGLWLQGELSNTKRHSSGNLFFTMKDADSALDGLMFRVDAAALPFVPKDGMQVLVWGAVSVYERTGRYRIVAQLMEPVGVGALALAFAQMKEKLAQEGLFDADFKRPIPENPSAIYVITSPTGAAVRDIITVARRRNPGVKLTVLPALVQGEGAAASIVAALQLANEAGAADCIILGRGGGSMEDLWAFNKEEVARAVFASELPVISAVGHETDFTICDFVADLRAATPSAAAELAVPDLMSLREEFFRLVTDLHGAMADLLAEREEELERLLSHPALSRPLQELERREDVLLQKLARIMRESRLQTQKQEFRLDQLIKRLEGVSPLAVLQRGYAVVSDSEGRVLLSSAQAPEGTRLHVRLREGSLEAEVINREVPHGQEKNL